ncbi:MAG: putative bacteriocin export ABC transporter [Streptococcaceae bacterium]|jgi:putative ABC transport system ATP-binding protein|nr:putative bacteriocin export ABC transporter [Streptococcaceae bacterium]
MIELKEIQKNFEEKVVLSGFNYTFSEGKSYALTGSSGSGKTTLLNMIGKLEKNDAGEILIDGKALDKISEKNYFKDQVGYLFQNYGLIDNETIEKNLDLALVGKRLGKSDKKKLMIAALQKVNLDLDIKRKIYSLSGGEAQRVAIAKIILKNPPIILADEPTASLDEKNGQEVIDLILSLNDGKKTIIIATHNPRVWEKLDEKVELSA